MTYATTSISPSEIKMAAEKNDHMFFLNVIAHYLGESPWKCANWGVCDTAIPEMYDAYHASQNILSYALFHQGHIHVLLWDGNLCYENSFTGEKWDVAIPELVKSLLDQIELLGPDRQIGYDEFEPVWENWLAYHGIVIDPNVYEIL